MELVNYAPLGQRWVRHFLNRHPQLKSVTASSIDQNCTKDTSVDVLKKWFGAFEDAMKRFNVKPQNVYNMDESGFAIGTIEATHVIINAETHQQYQANPGRQEWVSVIECISADGTEIPLLVIFKGKIS